MIGERDRSAGQQHEHERQRHVLSGQRFADCIRLAARLTQIPRRRPVGRREHQRERERDQRLTRAGEHDPADAEDSDRG